VPIKNSHESKAMNLFKAVEYYPAINDKFAREQGLLHNSTTFNRKVLMGTMVEML
jgi:hypothetical protein